MGETGTGFELLEPEARRNPYEIYARGRRDTPVQRVGSLDVFLVYRYADVQEIMRDTQLWLRPGTTLRPDHDTPQEPSSSTDSNAIDYRRMDSLLRQVFAPRVMPRLIREREAHLRAVVESLLDEALERRSVDLIDALASPLPMTVIAEILGVPIEDRDRFRTWSNSITSAPVGDLFGRAVDIERQKRGESARAQLYQYFTQLTETRRRQPREDLLTALAHAEVDGERVTQDELLEILVLLLIAGNENTTALIGNAVVQFVKDASLWAALRQDPGLLPGAIEEVLRFESPFPLDPRIAARPIDLQGVHIDRGQTAICLLGSANRDESAFERPELFNIRRSPNRHVAFSYGPHFCLGANLARLEARIALEALFRRTRSVEFAAAEPLLQNDSLYLRGFRSIPVVLEAV